MLLLVLQFIWNWKISLQLRCVCPRAFKSFLQKRTLVSLIRAWVGSQVLHWSQPMSELFPADQCVFNLICIFVAFWYFRPINLCAGSLWNWVFLCKCKVQSNGGQPRKMLFDTPFMIIFVWVNWNHNIYQLYFNHDYPYYLGLRQQSAKPIGGELKLLVGNINKSFKSSLQPGKGVFFHFIGTNGNLNPGKWKKIVGEKFQAVRCMLPGVNVQPEPVRLSVLVV